MIFLLTAIFINFFLYLFPRYFGLSYFKEIIFKLSTIKNIKLMDDDERFKFLINLSTFLIRKSLFFLIFLSFFYLIFDYLLSVNNYISYSNGIFVWSVYAVLMVFLFNFFKKKL